jgi:hypothetical protein
LPGCAKLADVAALFMLAGLVALWRSPWWTAQQKWLTFAALVVPNLILQGVTNAMAGGVIVAVRWIVELAARAATLIWLWHRRTVPIGPRRVPVPRWLGILLWTALAVSVLIAVLGGLAIYSLSGNVQPVTLNP